MPPVLRMLAAAAIAAGSLPASLTAQSVLQRTPNLSGGWVGTPGSLQVNGLLRYRSVGDGEFLSLPTVELAYGLPANLLVGTNFAVQSPVVFRQTTELEPYIRWAPTVESASQPMQLALQLGFNSATESVDGELAAGYRIGPARLLAAARFFSHGYSDGARFAAAGGLVIHPFPGRVPIALAGDAGGVLDSPRADEVVWSAGLQAGLPVASATVSLQATNATSGTLEGRSVSTGRTRYGVELTLASPIGELLGVFVPRDVAARAVRPTQAPAGPSVQIAIREFAFVADRLTVPRGTTIVWTNYDDVVHTASSDDGAWNSGAIPPGRSWSATFDQPGIYSYHCGPHPYMRGTITVR
jgi:plastocyanin